MSRTSDIARFVALGWTRIQIAEVCGVTVASLRLHPDLMPLSPSEREIERRLLIRLSEPEREIERGMFEMPPLSASERAICLRQILEGL